MRARVFVTLKSGVLDPQGQAVEHTLARLGFDGVTGVRVGKLVELDLAGTDPVVAKAQVAEMCDKLIANTVIENYTIEIEA